MKITKWFLIFWVYSGLVFGQEKIRILNAEQTYKDKTKYPGATIMNGLVRISHKGAVLDCNKALLYQKQNIIHAYDDVVFNQGDTIIQTSKYVQYDGNTRKLISWGDVVLTDSKMRLTTDTLHFDRELNKAYYLSKGTIKDSVYTMISNKGFYQTEIKKFTAQDSVKVFGKQNQMDTNHLEYYTDSKQVYFYGPTDIKNPDTKAYAEGGFYDSKNKISYLKKNAFIKYQYRTLTADSIYHDKIKQFSSSYGNVKLLDTINKLVVKGEYAEYFKNKDSVFITKKAVAVRLLEQDSTYIHADTLLLTGKVKNRRMSAYHYVRFFKRGLSGQCDSLYNYPKRGLTQMFGKPVLWSPKNQMTGDFIYFLTDTLKNNLDSIFIKKNSFIIQKDSIGFNQIKGRDMYGKFKGRSLDNFLVKGNGEIVNYARDEQKKLFGIMWMRCSNIFFELKKGKIDKVTFLQQPSGKTYPRNKFPKTRKKLKGFRWLEKQRPKKKEDIFIRYESKKTIPKIPSPDQ